MSPDSSSNAQRSTGLLLGYGSAVGLLLAVGWLLPLTTVGSICIIGSVWGLVAIARAGSLRALYVIGLLMHLIACWWLAPTMQKFSGLPAAISIFFFLLFCVISALQFPLFGFLSAALTRRGLQLFAPALGWISAETVFFRIFPWTPGHALLVSPELAQLGYVVGAGGCSALLFILAALTQHPVQQCKRSCFAALILLLWYGYGDYRLTHIERDRLDPPVAVAVALIQGNISVEQKHSAELVGANVDQYREASLRAESKQPLDVVVWPETVLLNPLPVTLASLPGLALSNATLLLGALTYGPGQELHNSAWGVSPLSGAVSLPYHKQILMPYGEYTPGATIFPILSEINANVVEFTPGTAQTLIPISVQGRQIQLAPLICYEDVVPSLSHTAAANGADILVNMSNDGWFGDSPAALQHHQLAAWRAIETGLPLLRATNTGFTAVVNAFGVTEHTLAPRTVGTLQATIRTGPGPAAWGAAQAQIILRLLGLAVALFAAIQWLRTRLTRR